jgi:uncharacterized protein (TIGR02145 family)
VSIVPDAGSRLDGFHEAASCRNRSRHLSGLRNAIALTLALTLLGSTHLVQAQFSPVTAEWHVRSTDHFEVYYTQARDLDSIIRDAEHAYDRVSHDMRRDVSAKVPLMLVPTSRELPQSEGEAFAIVRASGAPARDHLFLSVEPRSGRGTMLTNGLRHVFEFDARSTQRSARDQNVSDAIASSKRMADGKEWTTANLSVDTSSSYCYDDAEPNCRRYGRLYTWESAQRGCQLLGDEWRLPTDDEWRQLARNHGGIADDSFDKGEAAYRALLSGGTSGFNAVLGGNRSVDGKYDRLEAHGLYWALSENDPTTAPFYNFAKGSHGLYRQPQGQKQMALSARCVRR